MAQKRLRIWPVAKFRKISYPYTPTLVRPIDISIPVIRAIGYMRCCTKSRPYTEAG